MKINWLKDHIELVIIFLGLIVLALLYFYKNGNLANNQVQLSNSNTTTNLPTTTPVPIVTPTPTPFTKYQVPELPVKESYTILLVGDSMIKSLGPNSDRLREYLKQYYPETVFGIFNYGLASTNVETLDERLHQPTTTDEGKVMPPILERQFDVVFVESFAYNPLSDDNLETGMEKQEEILYKFVTSIIESSPESVVVFMTTIAPNSEYFGQGVLDLSSEQRQQWVTERKAYLENHIQFAKEHHIPLVNVYESSQNANGQGSLQYINNQDYIHPSADGVELMASEMAVYLDQNGIIP